MHSFSFFIPPNLNSRLNGSSWPQEKVKFKIKMLGRIIALSIKSQCKQNS